MVAAMTLRAGLLALALASTVLTVLTACGGQGVAPSPSASLTRAGTTTAVSSPDSTSRGPKAGGEAPEMTEPELIADLVGFTSPSGNVGCYIDPATVRCDILERDWAPPPRPADCEFDYGQGITLTAGEAPTFVCAGDTTLGGGAPLAYGKSISAGTLQCDSAETGFTCRDSKTTHGFTIAREGYRFF